MDETKLQDRINLLEKEKMSLIGAYDGAINDCKYWLEQLKIPAVETPTE